MALFFTIIFPEIACADDNEGQLVYESINPSNMAPAFSAIRDKLIDTFNNAKMVVLVLGSFGLIGVSFLALFGKVKWVWLASLSFGLAIVSAAAAIIEYVSQDKYATQGSKADIKIVDSYKTTQTDGGKAGGAVAEVSGSVSAAESTTTNAIEEAEKSGGSMMSASEMLANISGSGGKSLDTVD